MGAAETPARRPGSGSVRPPSAGYLSPVGDRLWIRGYIREGGITLARIKCPPIRRWGVAKLVRRLTLDQEIIGSNPISPASPNFGAHRRQTAASQALDRAACRQTAHQ